MKKKFFIKKFLTFNDLGEEIIKTLFAIEVRNKLREAFKFKNEKEFEKKVEEVFDNARGSITFFFNKPTSSKNFFILNSLITPFKGKTANFFIEKIDLETAKLSLPKNFISAVGHQATAERISNLLKVDVKVNRIQVFFEVGDEALAFVPQHRFPEGKVLTREEFFKIPLDIFFIQRTG
jgi:NAD-dependent DNA ligase